MESLIRMEGPTEGYAEVEHEAPSEHLGRISHGFRSANWFLHTPVIGLIAIVVVVRLSE